MQRTSPGDARSRIVRDLVGRDQELTTLEGFLHEADDGPRALIVQGEPGIGKTALWTEALSLAETMGFLVLRCRPAEQEQRSAYAALADLLSPASENELAALPPPQRRALEVALLLEEPDGAAGSPRAVAAATLGVLDGRSRVCPVLLGVDDAQWVDRSSADALASALRRFQGGPILVLVTSRVSEEPPDPLGLRRALGAEGVSAFALTGLDLDATARLIHSHLGWEPAGPVLTTIHERSRGNPFFALELARAAMDAGGRLDRAVGIPAPADLAAMLRARVERSSPSARDTAITAAAAGAATIPLLERAVAVPEAVGPALDELRTAGLVEVHRDEVTFTHPLFASAMYGEASTAERRAVHARLALAASDVEERARHLALSTEAPNPEASAELEEAAAHAHARGAEWSAAELCLLAADLVPGTLRATSLRAVAADHLFRAGDRPAATRLLRTVIDDLPHGRERARLLLRLAQQVFFDDLHGSVEVGREVLAEDAATEHVVAEAHLAIARAHGELGEHVEARTWFGSALELAGSVGDPALVANVAACREFAEGGPILDRDVFLRAEDLNGDVEPFTIMDRPIASLAQLLVGEDELDEARPLVRSLLGEAIEAGDEPTEGWANMILGTLEERAGNLRLSLNHYERMRRLRTWPHEHPMHAYTEALLGRLDAARARLALPLVDDLLTPGSIWPSFVGSVLGFVELSAGDYAAAAAAFEPAWASFEWMFEMVEQPYLAYVFQGDAVEAFLHVDAREPAERVTDWLERRAAPLTWPRLHMLAARTRGTLLAADGDVEAAIASLETALRAHDACPVPFERARTLLALGSVRRRAKQKRPAREDLQAALAIFDRIGTPLWAQHARAELASIGGRAPTTGELTPTELRVARLAAAGRTNREIAGELFLSVRTVESHLSRTYAKLGVRSRTELASVLEPSLTAS